MKYTKLHLETNSISKNCDEVKFLMELYYLMKKYNIHRIYSVSLDKKKIISAEQLLGTTLGNNKFTNKILKFLDKHIPLIYFHIFYKNHIFRYKIDLKRLFKKYGIEKIGISSFNLYQGIHITDNKVCIREVDLVYQTGQIFHIDNLYLDI